MTSLGIWLALRLVSRAIERVRLKAFDRQIGALVGAANGLMLCLAITFFTVTMSEQGRESVRASRAGFYSACLLRRVDTLLPQVLHAAIDPFLHEFERQLVGQKPPP